METMSQKCCRIVFYSRSHSCPREILNGVWLQIKRTLISATQTKTSKLHHAYRTSVDDPRQHTLDHEGLYYKVSKEERDTLFKDCISASHLRLMNTFNENSFMVRKPALELTSYIRNINLNHPIPRFVLYGRTGAGKKCVMNYAMHACYRNNWIIVHVPCAGRFVRGWKKELVESSFTPGLYDLPTDGATWLNHFLLQNQGRLKDLKTTSEYIWTKREKADIGTPIEEIINFGLTRIKFSSDCIGVILKELRQQAQAGNLKVFVAISAVNAFFVQYNRLTALRNAEKKLLRPNEISLVQNFKKMLSPTWTHGVVVCTVEEKVNVVTIREKYSPEYLLGQEGFEALDPFVPILVPEYSEKEALSNIEYFIDHNWIQNDYGRTEEGKKEIIFVSNKNPMNLFDVCAPL